MSIEIIAHRGYSSTAPENTLAAVRAAIAAGADAIEWDLHVASCGTPVLFHDVHLGRTTNGVGPIRRRTLGQLKALDAGSWFSSEFAGESIPSLAEALDLVAESGARLYPEVKGYRELEDLDRMVRIVAERDLIGRTTFISMDYGVIDRIAGQSEAVGVGYIVEEASRFDDALERARAAGSRGMIDFDWRVAVADPSLVTRARDAGVELAVWTVDTAEDADRVLGAGIDRLTTNRVTDLLAWKARRG